MKFCIDGNLQILSGTEPVIKLSAKFNFSILFNPEKLKGTDPENLLKLASKTVALPSIPISGGKQPPRLLPMKIISFKLVICPILRGMQPVKLLFANDTTETVEFPIVSGIVHSNRLSFKNRASRCMLKSSRGTQPSKLLYRKSIYCTLGQVRTTVGKSPTNRLLLTSNSCMSVSFRKLSGIIPQNLLLLI